MTKWVSHGEAMTYARYANRTRVGEYALQSRRMVIRKVDA